MNHDPAAARAAPALAIVHRPEAGLFEADLGGRRAVCQYRLVDDRVVFTHTEVPPAFEGRGVAAQLVRAALDWVRAQRLVAEPRCSYVATYMRRHPDVQDLLAR